MGTKTCQVKLQDIEKFIVEIERAGGGVVRNYYS
jgi:hypothetical protein